ncbi:MAG: CHASE2 domain-containing protein [Chloroflexi bacterium]|nr:CHASE2 domain-containing protein [Chloroflexota bacterium]
MRIGSSQLRLRRFAPRATALSMAATALLGAAAGLAVVLVPLLGPIEQDTMAARFALRPSSHPRDIVIVAIDDRSFASLQERWPFPRSWHGIVLKQLHRAGARAVFYDVQFTEPTTPQQDDALFNSLGNTGGAILATTETNGHGHTDVLGGDANLALVHSRAAVSAFPVGTGGVIDRVPYEYGRVPTAAVAVATRVQGHPPSRSPFGSDGAYIDYQGPPGTFPTISFADVLRGRFKPAEVRGKVVVVGATSPSLQDLHATPMSSHQLMSGPEIQANAIWTVLHDSPLRAAPLGAGIVLVLLAAALSPLIRLRRTAGAVAVVTPIAAIAYLVGAQVAFDAGIVVPILGPLTALTVTAIASLVASHLLLTRELQATQLEIVLRLGRAAESRDGGTARHLERMAFLCEKLALAAGLSRREARLVRQASALHDVGKIAIPDHVLLNTGRLESQEREIMNQHAESGAQMLDGSPTSLVQIAQMIALTHHERWDGTGYPAGLSGEQIPLPGRICAICDVFDALVSRRRYKQPWGLEAALAEIEQGAGCQFDPRLTKLFLRIAPRLYRQLAASGDPDLSDLPGAEEAYADPHIPAEPSADTAYTLTR